MSFLSLSLSLSLPFSLSLFPTRTIDNNIIIVRYDKHVQLQGLLLEVVRNREKLD